MRSTIEDLDVLVVGGGPVGAALALGARQAGYRVGLLEQQAFPTFTPATPVTRVSTLNAAAMALLHDLGVAEAVLARRSLAFSDMEVWDAQSAARIHFAADTLGLPALGWTVEQRALEVSLWEALAAQGGQLFPQASWRALDAQEERVVLHLQDGRRLGAALVVAADGAESPLRTRMGIAVERRPYAMQALIATVRTQFPHAHTAWQRFDGANILAFLPLQDGRCSVVWSVPEALAETLGRFADPALAAALTEGLGRRLGTVEDVTDRACLPLVGRHARSYYHGRIVLVGDAAHTVHPLAGQGLNLGLADVQALLQVLQVPSGRDPAAPAGLRRYTQARRYENAWMLRAMEGMRWWFATPGMGEGGVWATGVRRLRAWGVQQVDRQVLLKQFFVDRALGTRTML
jgi:2-octaprenylphenol hydroxylase